MIMCIQHLGWGTGRLLPIGSDILLPRSPEMASFEDQDALSAPLSSNRVRTGHSQDMTAEGSIFDVFGFSTIKLFSMIIRGIISVSDHAGNSASSGLSIRESVFVSTGLSIGVGSVAGPSITPECRVCVLCVGLPARGSAEDLHQKRTLILRIIQKCHFKVLW